MYQYNPVFNRGDLIRKRQMSKKDLLASADGTECRVLVVSPNGETSIRFDPRVKEELEVKPKHT